MSELGELDRPGTPISPGAWDVRSEEWVLGEGADGDEGWVGATGAVLKSGATTAEAADGGAVTAPGAADADDADEGEAPPARPHPTTAQPTTRTTPSPAQPATRTTPPPAQPTPPTPRRTAAVDPVKALMHRHRELCERAVDPLEIAAGLEAHGVTDRTATRFRHRDVFSLAEEMYARVSRDGDTPVPAAAPEAPRAGADWILLTLLPGALCAATVVGLRLTDGQPRLAAAVVGTLAVALSLRAALARGPLSTTHHSPPRTLTLTCWLITYALLGDGLLRAAVNGGPDALPNGTPDSPWPLTATPILALTLSCAPAAWTAHFFTTRARRKLTLSRGLEDFTASVLPLLFGVFALYLCALTALLTLTGTALSDPTPYAGTLTPYAGTLTLGALLFLSRLLTTHGFTHAPALVLTAATTTELTALATAFASRLPGCDFLGTPVETLVQTWGPGAVPALACGAGATTLLLHSTRRLTRASAHAPTTDQPW
ncbi:hypothetical protein [Streptomyces sp. NPDC046909]|uniref:hypothetical protein n=1 Tax=Streptomyces sp. NPDC046909 TaxID=3155617 RepID=UPI0033EB9170